MESLVARRRLPHACPHQPSDELGSRRAFGRELRPSGYNATLWQAGLRGNDPRQGKRITTLEGVFLHRVAME